MPQRQYSKEQSKVSKTTPRVILPIAYGEYQETASEPNEFRRWLDMMRAAYPALFPVGIEAGCTLHDVLPASAKLPDVRFRRIKLKAGEQQVLTICSSDVMPNITGYTDVVEKALFLRRFDAPLWGLTYVFGRNDDYWYSDYSDMLSAVLGETRSCFRRDVIPRPPTDFPASIGDCLMTVRMPAATMTA